MSLSLPLHLCHRVSASLSPSVPTSFCLSQSPSPRVSLLLCTSLSSSHSVSVSLSVSPLPPLSVSSPPSLFRSVRVCLSLPPSFSLYPASIISPPMCRGSPRPHLDRGVGLRTERRQPGPLANYEQGYFAKWLTHQYHPTLYKS